MMMKKDNPHFCTCKAAHGCHIHVHPSPIVQVALNNLMAAMAAYDDNTGSRSLLHFKSSHAAGEFESITKNINSAPNTTNRLRPQILRDGKGTNKKI